MGKILKFCNSCEEGFAERFTFCPDCGGPLQAVELNPVEPVAAAQADPVVAAVEEPQAPSFIQEEVSEPVREMISDVPTHDEIEFASAPTEEIPAVIEEPILEVPVESVETRSRRTRKPSTAAKPGARKATVARTSPRRRKLPVPV